MEYIVLERHKRHIFAAVEDEQGYIKIVRHASLSYRPSYPDPMSEGQRASFALPK